MSGIGGEADLVVGDNVDGSVGRVGGQVRQVHSFEHHALASERGITVKKDRHNL